MDGETMIHRSVASALNGFREYLMNYVPRIPDDWLYTADRMETMVFNVYEGDFEGFEPPDTLMLYYPKRSFLDP